MRMGTLVYKKDKERFRRSIAHLYYGCVEGALSPLQRRANVFKKPKPF